MLKKYQTLEPDKLLEKIETTFKDEFHEELRLEGVMDMIDGLLLERYNAYILTLIEGYGMNDLKRLKALIEKKVSPSPKAPKKVFN